MIGVARYLPPGSGPERGAGMTSWVEPLGVRRVPDDLRTLARGRRRILLVRILEVVKSPPLEDWLRRHGCLIGEDHLEFEHYQVASIFYFAPSGGYTFFEHDQDDESGP
jgi:hypothetical protein